MKDRRALQIDHETPVSIHSALPLDRRAVPDRRIVEREGVASASHLVQRNNLLHHGIAIDHPTIILVRSGVKRLFWRDVALSAGRGEVVAIPAGFIADINNDPADDPDYDAISVMLHRDTVNSPLPNSGMLEEPRRLADAGGAIAEAIEAARAALIDNARIPDAVARHRVAELLLWIERAGFHFPQGRRPNMAMRVREIIGADIARAWSASEIAARLATSEATMRRRLAAEGVTLTKVMTDLRLLRALTLLQATDDPVSSIAFAVGYESQSGFASSFRERFGHAPSTVRVRKAD